MLEASGLPAAYSHNVFCQYKFWNQDEALIIPPLIPASGVGPDSAPLDGIHRFNHTQNFNVEVTDEFLDAIEDGALAVEVWGHRRGVFMDDSAVESLTGCWQAGTAVQMMF